MKKIYKRVLLALSFVLTIVVGQAGWTQQSADPGMLLGAAEKVVGLIDQGLASELGSHVSASIKEAGAFTEEDFVRDIYNVRRPLGVVTSREWGSISQIRHSGSDQMVVGHYVSVIFVTNFAGKSGLKEYVTFFLDADNVWRIAGYSLQ